MHRHKYWGQATPMDQLRVILGSICGQLSNLIDFQMKSPTKILRTARLCLDQAQDCLKLAEAVSKGDNTWTSSDPRGV